MQAGSSSYPCSFILNKFIAEKLYFTTITGVFDKIPLFYKVLVIILIVHRGIIQMLFNCERPYLELIWSLQESKEQ